MRRRLILVVVATTGLVVVAFALPLAALVRDVAHDRAIAAAERDMAALAPVLAVTQDPETIATAITQTTTGAADRLSVDLVDETVGDGTPMDSDALSLARDGSGFTRDSAGGAEIYSPVVTGDGKVSVIRARVPDALLRDGVTTAWTALAVVGVTLIGAGCLLADRLARSVTRDADELATTARALAGGASEVRARPSGVPEITDVATALNALADRIGELRSAERERVADLSHRLRTPLTALRLEADRAGISAIATGVDRLERDVSQIIDDARRPLHDGMETTCDLADVARRRTNFWAALAEDDERTSAASIDEGPIHVALGEDEAAAAIDALLTNVFSHTPDGTPYTVDLHRSGDGTRAVLEVRDHGPGIGAMTDASARGVSSTGSTGLGLDIVRRAAQRAGGGVRLEPADGGGLRVVVDLPTTAR